MTVLVAELAHKKAIDPERFSTNLEVLLNLNKTRTKHEKEIQDQLIEILKESAGAGFSTGSNIENASE